jgi:pimeloyl-ACP methyl ester carboxylesterase
VTATDNYRARSHRGTSARKAAIATVGGVRTRIIECAGTGPTVLLLHGFSDSADGWRAVIDALSKRGRRAVALDLPYFGRASRPTSEMFFPVIDDFVAAALNEYDTGERVVAVGNSIGGLAVLRATQNPSLPIAAAVAIGPAGMCVPWWMRLIRRTRPVNDRLLGLVDSQRATVVRGTVIGPALITTGFARAVACGQLSPAARSQYASHWGPGDLRRQLRLGGQAIAELTDNAVLVSTPFRAPVTLAWGTRDWICPPHAAAVVQKAHPEVTVRFIRDAGHCPQYNQPGLVADIIDDAVTAVRPQPSHRPNRQESLT